MVVSSIFFAGAESAKGHPSNCAYLPISSMKAAANICGCSLPISTAIPNSRYLLPALDNFGGSILVGIVGICIP